MFSFLLALLLAPQTVVPRISLPPRPQVGSLQARQRWQYQSWQVGDFGSFVIASTSNDSGSAFGMVCGKDCVWFVNFQSECKAGHSYPAMMNGPGGSKSLNLKCYPLERYYILTFPLDEDSANAVIRAKGGEIGFAFPLDSGKFGVSRFSLAGSVSAAAKAIALSDEKEASGQQGLRDFTI